ncbi:hypothetical protein C809_03014 [Lachnospiraceae bacterium MD335]|jgi:hypothetical protein|nr:hypothetical protein C809_03014 [Lachnospiraceae bacterium MD335]
MNRRIKKKVAIRKCEKSCDTMLKIWREAKVEEEFLQAKKNMYARRIAIIRKGGLK